MIGYALEKYSSTCQAVCHAQMHMLDKGLKVFKEKGVKVAKAEVGQMHDHTCFKALAVKELTRRERERAGSGGSAISNTKERWLSKRPFGIQNEENP